MFRESFKYYKSKKGSPSFEKVYDLHSEISDLNNDQIKRIRLDDEKCRWKSDVKQISLKNTRKHFTLKPPETWEVYTFNNKSGLIYIKNPFTAMGQRYWTVRCLKDYSSKSNKRNIDLLNILSEDQDWWDVAKKNKTILNKLRWATLGYHHNWDTKIYSEDSKDVFPKDLADVTAVIAYNLGYDNFNSEAAIINYYLMDSTLSGHTDHSEKNLTAPLFSFSFGQTAIFLLGGRTIEEEPLAIFLRSGDIAVMSEESRLCYHGVPRIVKATNRTWISTESDSKDVDDSEIIKICIDDKLWKPYNDYLNTCRINMNVRQVLNKDQKGLND